MKKISRFGFAVLSVALLTATVQAGSVFKAADPMGRNVVQFKTSAPLEDIVGTTNRVDGEVRVDPSSLKASDLYARFEVDLAGLKTGIGLRDRHMRENYLHIEQYPKARFTLERITRTSDQGLKPNKPNKLLAAGTFELHGVKRRIEVPVTVTYLPESEGTRGKLPGNLLRINSEFDVKLADYKIERPQMLVLKIGEVARVSLDIFASDATPEQMSMWMAEMQKMMASSE